VVLVEFVWKVLLNKLKIRVIARTVWFSGVATKSTTRRRVSEKVSGFDLIKRVYSCKKRSALNEVAAPSLQEQTRTGKFQVIQK